jgi:hypothetical protein
VGFVIAIQENEDVFKDKREIFFDGGEGFKQDLEAVVGEKIRQDGDQEIIGSKDGIEIQEPNTRRSIHDDQFIILFHKAKKPLEPEFPGVHGKKRELHWGEVEIGGNNIEGREVCFDDDPFEVLFLDQGAEQSLGILGVIKAQTLGEMALGVEIDHEGFHPHLSETKPVRGRNTALPCSPLKIQEELLAKRSDNGGKSQMIPIGDHILGFVRALLSVIPLGTGQNSLRFFLDQFLPKCQGSSKKSWECMPSLLRSSPVGSRVTIALS